MSRTRTSNGNSPQNNPAAVIGAQALTTRALSRDRLRLELAAGLILRRGEAFIVELVSVPTQNTGQ